MKKKPCLYLSTLYVKKRACRGQLPNTFVSRNIPTAEMPNNVQMAVLSEQRPAMNAASCPHALSPPVHGRSTETRGTG